MRSAKSSSDALVPTSVLVTTSKALVTRSDALVPTSLLKHFQREITGINTRQDLG